MAQVFIAHSSKDKWLIEPICDWLKDLGVKPYLAEREIAALSLTQKLEKAIRDSNAVIVIFTRNVADIQQTRDVVNWEVATAHTYRKPVYIFCEKGVELPFTFNGITTYATFDPFDEAKLIEVFRQLSDIGYKLKKDEDISKFILTGLFIVFGIVAFSNLVKGD
jgi:hypothetical protein